MMEYVNASLRDADVLIFITDTREKEMNHKETLEKIKQLDIPVLCLINKIDLSDQTVVTQQMAYWQELLPKAEVYPVSALHSFNVETVWERIRSWIPENPPYFDKEELSDRPMRFFVSEIIREKIFLHCEKEVPYSSQVEIDTYEETGNLVKIRAQIIVERNSQKGILIGKGGEMLKKIGRDARMEIEKFIDRKVFLETFVKVDKDWRSTDQKLKKYGY
jgi:GTP-binding protein Era